MSEQAVREAHAVPGSRPLVARLGRGVVGGFAAGVVFIALNMWYAASTGGPAAMPLHAISTLVLGDHAMAAGATNPVLGAVAHVVLSVAFGVVFALVAPRLRTNAMVVLGGTAYGLLLFVVNFLVLAPLLFTTFTMPNKPFELVVHLVFGTLLAFAFLRQEQPIASRPAPRTS